MRRGGQGHEYLETVEPPARSPAHAPPRCALALFAFPACATAAAATPQVGFAVEAGGITCRISGPTRVVERNVYGGNAVAQVRPGGDLEVVLMDEVEPCIHVAYARDGSRDGTGLGDCPAPLPRGRATARTDTEIVQARQTRDANAVRHIMVGFVTYDSPRANFGIAHEGRAQLVEHRLVPPPGGPGGGEMAPALAPLGAEGTGFVLAWVEGDTVRAQPLANGAEPAGPPVEIALAEASEIGRPSVAFAYDGSGLVAFTATTPAGHDAFAVPIVCSR